MTRIGIEHYGGTLGLYSQPREEQIRAVAFYEFHEDIRKERREKRRREREKRDARG